MKICYRSNRMNLDVATTSHSLVLKSCEILPLIPVAGQELDYVALSICWQSDTS